MFVILPVKSVYVMLRMIKYSYHEYNYIMSAWLARLIYKHSVLNNNT